MSSVNVRLPNSLHKRLRECAKKEGTSINQLISSAVAEKLASLMTVDYLQERAKRGSRKNFEAALLSTRLKSAGLASLRLGLHLRRRPR